MSRHKYLLGLFVVYLIQIVYGNVILSDLSFKKDDCKDICSDNLFLLPLVNDANNICNRGCRLFNIIDAKGDLNYNKTKHDCHSSCIEAYGSPDFEACKLGCNEMQKKKEIVKCIGCDENITHSRRCVIGDWHFSTIVKSEISSGFVVYIEQEGQSNIMVVQPELDQVDLDILSDPGLRGQLDFGYSVEYKIPETHIRTMPISEATDNYGMPPDIPMRQYQPTGDWLDCASRNSGIPRWMLVSAILLAVLLGIWLIFASEKRESLPTSDLSDNEVLVNNVEYPPPPPKYSLESEKV